MNRYTSITLIIISAFFLTGCDQTSGILGGGAIGTAAGAGLGYALSGGSAGATLLGGVVGGLTGASIGNQEACNQQKKANAKKPCCTSNGSCYKQKVYKTETVYLEDDEPATIRYCETVSGPGYKETYCEEHY